MTLYLDTWRPKPLLPVRDGVAAWMVLAAFVVSVAGSLTLGWLVADLSARPGILQRLQGEATVAIKVPKSLAGLEGSDAAAWRASEVLGATPGVASVEVLEPTPRDQSIAASMGAGGSTADPPRLIALTFAPGVRLQGAFLGRRLAGAGATAAVDDHGLFSGPVERSTFLATAGLSAVGLVLLGVSALLGGLGAARRTTRLGARIGLLFRLGMSERALIGHILEPLAFAAFGISVAGTVVAWAVVRLGAVRPPGLAPFIPQPDFAALLAMAGWPPLAVGASVLTAALVAALGVRRVCK